MTLERCLYVMWICFVVTGWFLHSYQLWKELRRERDRRRSLEIQLERMEQSYESLRYRINEELERFHV